MSLSDLASLGSFVSGLAVLVSLAFLAFQARYMIRNQQSLVHLGRTQLMNDMFAPLLSPETTEIMLKGNRGDVGLTLSEHFRFANVVWMSVMLAQNDFLQRRAGLMTDEQLEANLGLLRFQCLMPGFRAWWVHARTMFEKHFMAFVDDLLAQVHAVNDPTNISYQVWKTEAAKELASAKPTY
jgi:hypothetical protein